MFTIADPTTTFLFLRHASTIWNVEGRFAGSQEVPLAPEAEIQIAQLTRQLLEVPLAAIYSSPLSRCVATIEPIARIKDLSIELCPELIERSLGRWEGKTADELSTTYPEGAYNPSIYIPQAEPLEHVELRLQHFLNQVTKDHPQQTILVSTHAGVIWTLLSRMVLNRSQKPTWPLNTSFTKIIWHDQDLLWQKESPTPMG